MIRLHLQSGTRILHYLLFTLGLGTGGGSSDPTRKRNATGRFIVSWFCCQTSAQEWIQEHGQIYQHVHSSTSEKQGGHMSLLHIVAPTVLCFLFLLAHACFSSACLRSKQTSCDMCSMLSNLTGRVVPKQNDRITTRTVCSASTLKFDA